MDPIGGEHHKSHRVGWLRAAVLGANDGIVSTASLVIGVAAAGSDRGAIVTAGVAGLVAGAMSMAAGEYISVSSQRDTELADLRIEREALASDPDVEERELAAIYQQRGLSPELARQVAAELHQHDAFGAHARDELGITDMSVANPVLAAWTSALAFGIGAVLPVLAVALAPGSARIATTAVAGLLALALLGFLGAKAGGAPPGRAIARVITWSSAAMLLTWVIGRLVGTAV